MMILGVDNASKLCGIAVLEGEKLLYKEQYKTGLQPRATDEQLADALWDYYVHLSGIIFSQNIDKVVVELSGVTRNANTARLLCYFESAVLLAAKAEYISVERIRTTTVRKAVLGSGATPKGEVVARVIEKYGEMSEDEAEAIVFALYGGGLTL